MSKKIRLELDPTPIPEDPTPEPDEPIPMPKPPTPGPALKLIIAVEI
jgi:hypothetical protein